MFDYCHAGGMAPDPANPPLHPLAAMSLREVEQRRRVPLRERPRFGGGSPGGGSPTSGRAPARSGRPGEERQRRPTVRHVWVIDPPGLPGRWPGVLIEWVRDGSGWRGRVVLVVDDAGGPRVLTRWVAGDRLVPAS
jgi:hypothetical protein